MKVVIKTIDKKELSFDDCLSDNLDSAMVIVGLDGNEYEVDTRELHRVFSALFPSGVDYNVELNNGE